MTTEEAKVWIERLDSPHISNEVREASRVVLAALAEAERWKPLTPAEAQKAFDEAEAVPLSEERIQEIVAAATDPATKLPNDEQAQMAVRTKTLEAARDQAVAENAGLREALTTTSKVCCNVVGVLPCRVDEMTEREFKIYEVGTQAFGALRFIGRAAQDALASPGPGVALLKEVEALREVAEAAKRYRNPPAINYNATPSHMPDNPGQDLDDAIARLEGARGGEGEGRGEVHCWPLARPLIS